MKVELIRAWPRRFERIELELPDGVCVNDALRAAGWYDGAVPPECAVFGIIASPATRLCDCDRIELLRPLVIDPKEARRRRATTRPG